MNFRAMAIEKVCKALCIALVCLLVVACSNSLSEQEAEAIALEFLSTKGIFYTSSQDGKQNVPQYETTVLTSEKQGSMWKCLIGISSEVNGTTKKAYVSLGVQNNGEVQVLATN